MTLHLISHALCPFVQRAVIALTEKGVPFRRTDIDLAAKPDWFLALSPLGKTPVLVAGGRPVFESAVILDYLEETQPIPLYPADPLERARHRAFGAVASAILGDIAALYNAPDAQDFDRRAAALRDRFTRLEPELGQGGASGPWFAGSDFGLVDAAFGPVFRYFDTFERIGAFGILYQLPRIAAWRAALAARPSVAAAVRPDYPQLLLRFLEGRNSHISRLIAAGAGGAATAAE
ncbi:glutathione S-transferase family protein [Rhodobacteraceae bacterium 2CG4]|uniref:glutathione transferase n=1 Tax=Halovulum marinum TaxID=2662447 RepID=A0A6L5Z1Q0_9RHOB|nr:glutathione S-transferase family protein [Halovulum marinum]MSU90219.1 glutathione S-transferase family protein [Halovulum marinum]